jgi:hypothetical protein
MLRGVVRWSLVLLLELVENPTGITPLDMAGSKPIQKQEKQKAIPKDGLSACFVWLPDLGSNQGPAD